MGALEDIQRRLRNHQYKNEEHVRLSLLARVLQEYGWAIWDPTEVYAEFVPVPQEDNKKVDLALFGPGSVPLVFIEVKAVGGIRDIGQTERQLRDYNRNITAPLLHHY
jgi:predicted type IV restriction endonuclease